MEQSEEDQPKEGEQLSGEQRRQLRLLVEEFSGVFQNTSGSSEILEHRIPTGTSNPVRLPPYRVPYAHRETLRQELKEMLERKIIEPLAAEWSSPIVLVGKKNGTLRLCVDYRRLNELSTMDAYPIPRKSKLLFNHRPNKGILAGTCSRGGPTQNKHHLDFTNSL